MKPTVHPRRRAGAYVIVLVTAGMVTMVGLSALVAQRIQLRMAEQGSGLAQARFYARSAIELGVFWIDHDPAWRDDRPHGVWVVDQPISDGTFTLEVVDPGDGDLANSASDPVVLTGTGRKGTARYKLEVTLVPQGQALTCLETSLHAGNDLIFNSATVNGDQIISANNLIQAIGACTIYPATESVNGFTGVVGPGPVTWPITPRTMPDGTVFDPYLSAGTLIDIAGIPTSGSVATISGELIGPARNPYGPTNELGIYVINCAGQRLVVEDSRIVGTLVLLDPGAGSEVSGSVNWEPALGNYPALLVAGALRFSFTTAMLNEQTVGMNFNPAGTPYLGVENTELVDTYPSLITGLVYVSGDAESLNACTFDGVVVVGGTMSATGRLDLTYRQTFLDNPPPGFGEASVMTVSPGSWRQVVD